MAPRGKKTEAEAEAPKTATQPAETSTPAGDLSTAPTTGDAAPLGQADSAAAGTVVGAEVVTGDDVASGAPSTPVSDPSEADSGEAAVSTAAANEALAAIVAEAGKVPTFPPPIVLGVDMAAPERRWFVVADPVSLNGEDFLIGDGVKVTETIHAELRKAGVIIQPWADGVAL